MQMIKKRKEQIKGKVELSWKQFSKEQAQSLESQAETKSLNGNSWVFSYFSLSKEME